MGVVVGVAKLNVSGLLELFDSITRFLFLPGTGEGEGEGGRVTARGRRREDGEETI